MGDTMLKLIDFYADWCGPCQVMAPIFEEVEKELANQAEFAKIDVDQNQKEAAQYGVLSIPTYILENDGKEVDRKIGAMSKHALKNWIESHL